MLLAIDPGYIESAWVLFDGSGVVSHGKQTNADVLALCRHKIDSIADELAIEMVESFGMAVGKETFETVYWIGRFCEAWGDDSTLKRVYRKTVCGALCRNGRASDSNIRQACVDHYGGETKAIGGKRCDKCKGKGVVGRNKEPCEIWKHPPGPLWGLARDEWQAMGLALAVTHYGAEAVQ